VHKLVTFLSGHLKITSEKGVGTQVDVYIPAQRPDQWASPSSQGSR
jgi:sensor histidine kinase regulating citrate/malate metabolism